MTANSLEPAKRIRRPSLSFHLIDVPQQVASYHRDTLRDPALPLYANMSLVTPETGVGSAGAQAAGDVGCICLLALGWHVIAWLGHADGSEYTKVRIHCGSRSCWFDHSHSSQPLNRQSRASGVHLRDRRVFSAQSRVKPDLVRKLRRN